MTKQEEKTYKCPFCGEPKSAPEIICPCEVKDCEYNAGEFYK